MNNRYTMQKKNIVILGAGIGGIITANNLRNKLPGDVSITIIEKNPVHTFPASYLWLMVNKRRPKQIKSPLQNLLNSSINLKIASILHIDVKSKKITTDKEVIDYDFLVISLGAELDFSSCDIKDDNICSFYNFDGAIKLRDSLLNFKGGKIVIAISSLPYKCPGAPYEGAMLIHEFLQKRNLAITSSVSLYSPEPHPLPIAGPILGNTVAEMLAKKQISYFPLHASTSIDSTQKIIKFSNDARAEYDLLVIIPQHKAPHAILNSSLNDESGWIPVGRETLETKNENVFAIGDVTSVTMPGRWSPDKPLKLPKAGVFAHSQALIVSEIIASRILGYDTKASFCGDGFCMLEAGEDLAGFAYGDFFASPQPDVKMKTIGKKWHIGKVLFERWWLSPYGFRKSFYKALIEYGAKRLKIPASL